VNDALMITTIQPVVGGENVSVIFVNGGDGTVVPALPAANYPLAR